MGTWQRRHGRIVPGQMPCAPCLGNVEAKDGAWARRVAGTEPAQVALIEPRDRSQGERQLREALTTYRDAGDRRRGPRQGDLPACPRARAHCARGGAPCRDGRGPTVGRPGTEVAAVAP